MSDSAEQIPETDDGSVRVKRPANTFEQRKINSAEKRRTSERRRQVDPTTCEREYVDDEVTFMQAMDEYKRVNRRPFPTWSEVLEVIKALGYRKVADATPLPGSKKLPQKG